MAPLRPVFLRWAAPTVVVAVVVTGCFKTLDESLMEGNGGAASGGLGGTGGSTGGSGGTAAGGTGAAGGSGATGGVAGDGGGGDAPVEAGIVPYDAKKYPVGNIGTGTAPVIIASDDTNVFRATKNLPNANIVAQPLAGGSGVTLATAERPEAMSAAVGGQYLFVAAGNNTTGEGSLLRIPKGGGQKDPVGSAAPIEVAKGIFAAPDNFVYVSTQAMTPNAVGVLRFGNVATLTEPLYIATGGNESGGDIVVASGCVYWISNGAVWVMPSSGGTRSAALKTQSTDAVGLAADGKNLYVTRADGSVWRRTLSSAACDGLGPAEVLLASGFDTIGDVIAFDDKIAWTAMGDLANGYAGGGVFMMPAAGGTITQIAPSNPGPVDIDQSPTHVVYATDKGTVHRVPKVAQ